MALLLVLKSVGLVRVAAASSDAPSDGKPAIEAPPPNTRPDAVNAPASRQAGAATVKQAGAPADPASNPPEAPVSDSERALLVDLRARRAELDAREATLASREAVLGAAEKRLAARIDELNSLQRKLESLEVVRKDRDEANWRGLVKLYESMKPRDAAAIFNDLDMPVLLQVVDRMKEIKAAPVLAAMQPDRARQLTAELAQMRVHANAPQASGGKDVSAKIGGSG
jgi:flagellar motility protein MotE (MotC chaperone)